jgi:hypothetical protein
MSTTIDEDDLRFSFDGDWVVVKWDAHAAYTDGLQRFPGTKAVDFLGLFMDAPWFIEVKDFRSHRIENKDRLQSGDLAREVGEKVRDTLAALAWACGRDGLNQNNVHQLLGRLVNRDTKVPVVLWLEEDRPASPAECSTLAQLIKREIRWLNPKVLIAHRAAEPPQGLTVTDVPGPPPP